MKNKKLAVIVDDAYVNNAIAQQSLPTDSTLKPTSDLINNLKDYFMLEDMMFLTPETAMSNDHPFELSGEEGDKIKTSDENVDKLQTDSMLIFSVNSRSPKFSYDYLASQYDTYGRLTDRVNQFLNPLHAKRMIDKKYLHHLMPGKEHVFPEQYNFEGWNSLYDIVEENGIVVLKHRMGAEGEQVYLLDSDNFDEIQRKIAHEVKDYVAQEFIQADYEKRLIIFGDEIVGGRIINKRNHPWEKPDQVKQGYSKKAYEPTKPETELAIELHKASNLDYSAVDFIGNSEQQKILEINGICPGLTSRTGDGGIVYSLNPKFAEFLYHRTN